MQKANNAHHSSGLRAVSSVGVKDPWRANSTTTVFFNPVIFDSILYQLGLGNRMQVQEEFPRGLGAKGIGRKSLCDLTSDLVAA